MTNFFCDGCIFCATSVKYLCCRFSGSIGGVFMATSRPPSSRVTPATDRRGSLTDRSSDNSVFSLFFAGHSLSTIGILHAFFRQWLILLWTRNCCIFRSLKICTAPSLPSLPSQYRTLLGLISCGCTLPLSVPRPARSRPVPRPRLPRTGGGPRPTEAIPTVFYDCFSFYTGPTTS